MSPNGSFKRPACDQRFLELGRAKIRERGECSMIDPRSQPDQWQAWWNYFCGIGSAYWQKTMLSIERHAQPHGKLATPTDWPHEFDQRALDHPLREFPWETPPPLTFGERAEIIDLAKEGRRRWQRSAKP